MLVQYFLIFDSIVRFNYTFLIDINLIEIHILLEYTFFYIYRNTCTQTCKIPIFLHKGYLIVVGEVNNKGIPCLWL